MGHARDFSGSRTRLRWSMHQASAVWWGWCARASDFLGKSWGILEPVVKFWESSAGNSGKFWENPGFLHHQTASFVGAPITPRERRHVTQPRARINVSCSRADHKGERGTTEKRVERTAKDSRRTAEGWVPDEGRDRAGQGRHSPEIAHGIAPLIHSDGC